MFNSVISMRFFPLKKIQTLLSHNIRKCFFIRYTEVCVCVIIAGLFLLCSSCWAIGSDSNSNATLNDLQLRGKQFRIEVDSTFMKMSKADSRGHYDLMSVCEKYFPVDTSFADAEVMLLAAGTHPVKSGDTIWVPDYNHRLPVDSLDKNDLGSGFVLSKSLISNALFGITFRPKTVNA